MPHDPADQPVYLTPSGDGTLDPAQADPLCPGPVGHLVSTELEAWARLMLDGVLFGRGEVIDGRPDLSGSDAYRRAMARRFAPVRGLGFTIDEPSAAHASTDPGQSPQIPGCLGCAADLAESRGVPRHPMARGPHTCALGRCWRCDTERNPSERGSLVRDGERWLCDDCTTDNRALTREEVPATRRGDTTTATNLRRLWYR